MSVGVVHALGRLTSQKWAVYGPPCQPQCACFIERCTSAPKKAPALTLGRCNFCTDAVVTFTIWVARFHGTEKSATDCRLILVSPAFGKEIAHLFERLFELERLPDVYQSNRHLRFIFGLRSRADLGHHGVVSSSLGLKRSSGDDHGHAFNLDMRARTFSSARAGAVGQIRGAAAVTADLSAARRQRWSPDSRRRRQLVPTSFHPCSNQAASKSSIQHSGPPRI
jgi:hypothetical protein